jgi:hypothetical protein
MSHVHFLSERVGKPADDNIYLVSEIDDATDDGKVIIRTDDADQAAKLCGWLNGAVAER